jgi:hypothetical protein
MRDFITVWEITVNGRRYTFGTKMSDPRKAIDLFQIEYARLRKGVAYNVDNLKRVTGIDILE